MRRNQAFPPIETAIAQLGYPEIVWFRGHTRAHQLLPWLFRLPGAFEKEQKITQQFRRGISKYNSDIPHDGLLTFIAMYNSYLPTRLLAWTRNLAAALFCAIARESPDSSIFVLDPEKLNTCSNIEKIPALHSFGHGNAYLHDWFTNLSLPTLPIAVDGSAGTSEAPFTEAIFTAHGTDTRPLELQCPECV